MIDVLSDGLLEDHLRCPSKSYLRVQGRLGQATAYSNLCAKLDARHRTNAFHWLKTQFAAAGVKSLEGSRLDHLDADAAFILDAVAGAEGLETHFHGLQRVPGESKLGAFYYQPLRAHRNRQPNSVIRLLLAFDALLLGHLQGLLPEYGILICGPAFKLIRVHLSDCRLTAYDSIQNPQQKCLIHLIRDMNEDMTANPFDAELRGIAQAFASVMRPIIETVDRYGLTKSRLQKHKAAAMRFVGKVIGSSVSSEAAKKYQRRIDKYSNRLFTFLDYDGVTWNNNNAEHAIKAFARYRRLADGRFTIKSLNDYLTILSVFQTCEHRGERVLKFLTTGRTALTFSESVMQGGMLTH
jgi:hypothetical protein